MMKKRMISFMLLTLTVLAAKAQENVFRLSGSLESTGDTITVYCVDLAQRRIVETKPVAVSADKFETTMELAQPVMLMLQNKPAPGRLNSRIQIFAVPNSQCAINGKWLDYTLSGDQFYLDLNEIKQLTAETDKAMHDLSWECQQRANNGEKEDVIMKYYEEKSAPILEKKNKLVMDYAASHGNHDATATLLMAVEPEQAQGLCDKLSETVRNGQMKPMIDGTMAQVKKELARIFQALRIEVNHELDALPEMLNAACKLLRPDGRLVVLTYHSLEDRIVKNFLRSGNSEGEIEKDFFGRFTAPLTAVGKALSPSAAEQAENPRSRSAKLRIGKKNATEANTANKTH